VLNLTLAVGL